MTGRPYRPRTRKPAQKPTRARSSSNLKIRFRGRDGRPLSMKEFQQGLFELAQRLDPYIRTWRAKSATLYVTVVDQNGCELSVAVNSEWSIFPYVSAADERDRAQQAADEMDAAAKANPVKSGWSEVCKT